MFCYLLLFVFFFFNDTATTEIYTYGHTLSLHDALPIFEQLAAAFRKLAVLEPPAERPASTAPAAPGHVASDHAAPNRAAATEPDAAPDRKSTRLNSSH